VASCSLESFFSLDSELLPKRASALGAEKSTPATSAAQSRLRMDSTVQLLEQGVAMVSAGLMDGVCSNVFKPRIQGSKQITLPCW
jgi:hypothetical protein